MKNLEENRKEIHMLIDCLNGKRHDNYKHVVDYSTLLRRLNSKDTDSLYGELLRQHTREDSETFNTRKEITIPICYPIINRIMAPTSKIMRSGDLVVTPVYESNGKTDSDILFKIEQKASTFHQNDTIIKYANEQAILLNRIDPNAWIGVKWDAFDNLQRTATAEPYVIWSSNAYDYEIKNGNTEWLIASTSDRIVSIEVQTPEGLVTITEGSEEVVTYLGMNKNIQLSRASKDTGGAIKITHDGIDGYYQIEVYNHNRGFVFATQAGYIRDSETLNQTYVCYYDASLSNLRRIVKIGSEFDITVSEIAYPRIYEAEQECPNPQCEHGTIIGAQDSCNVCQGTGFVTSNRSVLNIKKFKIADNKEDQLDPSMMVHYVEPPIDSIKFQHEIISNETTEAIEAVYNPDVLAKTTFSKTATEANIKTENIYDVLHPFAENIGRINNFLWSAVAASLGLKDGFSITSKVKSNFAFKSMMDLVSELSALTSVGVDPLTNQAISQIAKLEFAGQPKQLLEYQVKSKFDPFMGKTSEEINMLINNNLVANDTKILHANFNQIFELLDRTVNGFYTLDYPIQRKLINEAVNDIALQIKEQSQPIL